MAISLAETFALFRQDLYRRCTLEGRRQSLWQLTRLMFKSGMLSTLIYRLNHYFYFKRPYSYIIYRLLRLVEYYYCHNELECQAVIGPGLVIGDFGWLAISDAVVVGRNCTFAGKATLTLGGIEGIDPSDRIRLGDHCIVGHNVRIINTVSIASGVQIKSNSVVIASEALEGAIISGFPAKKINILQMSRVLRWNPLLCRLSQ